MMIEQKVGKEEKISIKAVLVRIHLQTRSLHFFYLATKASSVFSKKGYTNTAH